MLRFWTDFVFQEAVRKHPTARGLCSYDIRRA